MNKVDRFEIRRPLGRGGFGDVHLAWDPVRKIEIALKVAHLRMIDPELLEVQRRGLALQRLLSQKATHVAAVYEIGEDDQFFWAAFEYVAGNDLHGLLAKGPLPESTSITIALEICRFLEVAHNFSGEVDGRQISGIIHGNIKPGNIRLQPGGRIRVLGFGIAIPLTLGERSAKNVFATSQFAAPERLQQSLVDRASDLWAVGVLLYQMVTGKFPFSGGDDELMRRLRSGRPPDPLPDSVSPALARVILKTLAYDPAQRYPSAAALATDLRACLEGSEPSMAAIGPVTLEVTAAVQVSPPRPLPRPGGRFLGVQEKSKASWIGSLRPLDVLPHSVALGVGGTVGGISAILLVNFAPLPVMVAGFLLLLGLAAGIAWSGKPVLIEEPALERGPAENAVAESYEKVPELAGVPPSAPAPTTPIGSPK
jgi:serine/threonine protein kinase